MQDLKINFTADVHSGITTLSLDLTPQGGLATVSGAARMVQNVLRWFITPQGSLPYDPTFGNALFALKGQPNNRDASAWLAMFKQVEYDFLTRQVQLVQQGALANDETVAAFSGEQVGFPTVFTVSLITDVISQAGAKASLPGPIFFSTRT